MNKEFPQFSAWIKVMHCYIARKNTGQLVKAEAKYKIAFKIEMSAIFGI